MKVKISGHRSSHPSKSRKPLSYPVNPRPNQICDVVRIHIHHWDMRVARNTVGRQIKRLDNPTSFDERSGIGVSPFAVRNPGGRVLDIVAPYEQMGHLFRFSDVLGRRRRLDDDHALEEFRVTRGGFEGEVATLTMRNQPDRPGPLRSSWSAAIPHPLYRSGPASGSTPMGGSVVDPQRTSRR